MSKVAIIIPAYKVRSHILSVVEKSLSNADMVIIVDDGCPEKSGEVVREKFSYEKRVVVVTLEKNSGVGGAVKSGMVRARLLGASVLVKIDGDGQIDPSLTQPLIRPILDGIADYAKGNRFNSFDGLSKMPKIRLLGNSALSFFSKLSSGYWNVSDPTNGLVAMSIELFDTLPLEKIHNRYFFESDLLFRIGLECAVVYELPMHAFYGDEKSNLKIGRTLVEFSMLHAHRTIKRLVYSYILRDFNAGSLQLFIGVPLIFFGTIFGGIKWYEASQSMIRTPLGTIIVATLPLIVGFQFFLGWLNYDILQAASLKCRRIVKKRRLN